MIVNVIVTMGVWLVYATTIRSRPAPYIHPWREPEAAAEVITAFSNYSSNMSLAESIGSVEFEYKDNSSRLNESKTHVHDEFESKNNTPVEIKLEDEAMSISGKN